MITPTTLVVEEMDVRMEEGKGDAEKRTELRWRGDKGNSHEGPTEERGNTFESETQSSK